MVTASLPNVAVFILSSLPGVEGDSQLSDQIMILRSNELCDAGHVMSQRGVRTTRSAECIRGVFSEVAAAFNSVRSIPVAGPVQPMRFPENTKCGQEDAMIRWLWRKRTQNCLASIGIWNGRDKYGLFQSKNEPGEAP